MPTGCRSRAIRLERLVLARWHLHATMADLLAMRGTPVGRRVRLLAARSLNIALELHGPGDGTFPRVRLDLRRASRLDLSAHRPLPMLDQCAQVFAACAGELRQVDVALPPDALSTFARASPPCSPRCRRM